MNRVRSRVTAFCVVATLAIACANGDEGSAPATNEPVDSGGGTITPPKPDGSTITPPGTADTGTTQSKVCVANCATDSECQTSCPAAPNGGLNCCDVNSGVCYATSGTSCGGVDGGVD
jgi:hypothetical protein